MSNIRKTEALTAEDSVNYNPEKKYYFLSVFDNENVSWIRMPFMTRREIVASLDEMIGAKYIDEETGGTALRYVDIEIFSEDTLNDKSKYLCKDGEYHELTLREAIFDGRYEKNYKRIIKSPEKLDAWYSRKREERKLKTLLHTELID